MAFKEKIWEVVATGRWRFKVMVEESGLTKMQSPRNYETKHEAVAEYVAIREWMAGESDLVQKTLRPALRDAEVKLQNLRTRLNDEKNSHAATRQEVQTKQIEIGNYCGEINRANATIDDMSVKLAGVRKDWSEKYAELLFNHNAERERADHYQDLWDNRRHWGKPWTWLS